MSELTRCNFCNLRAYKKEARQKGWTITLKRRKIAKGMSGGIAITEYV